MESHRLRGVTLLRRLRRYALCMFSFSGVVSLHMSSFSRRKHKPAVRSVLRVPVNFRSNGFSASFRESRSFRAIRLIFPFLETHFAPRQIVSPNKNSWFSLRWSLLVVGTWQGKGRLTRTFVLKLTQLKNKQIRLAGSPRLLLFLGTAFVDYKTVTRCWALVSSLRAGAA